MTLLLGIEKQGKFYIQQKKHLKESYMMLRLQQVTMCFSLQHLIKMKPKISYMRLS